MTANMFNPEVSAAEYAINLYNALKRLNVNEKDGRLEAPGLYTRARQYPSLLAQAGLIPATSFALAKTSNLNAVDEAFNAMKGGSGGNHLKKDATERGGGYGIIAALIARTLVDSGECIEDANTRVAVWLSKCLIEKFSQGSKALAAEAIVLAVLQEFKKNVEVFVAKPDKEE